ncbi:patatin-like phospholipase family protein [Candidatus Woesearchaeota archaeon]|nr:patatin-like phospholipase family protein [Candidatus Woesearchaeota archaeon]
MSKKNKLRTGLVFSGGASRGWAFIGVLKALEEANIKIDYIGGSSMGALLAAVYASGRFSVDEMIDIACSFHKKDIFSVYGFLRARGGVTSIHRTRRRFLKKLYPPDLDFKDLKIPLFINGLDMKTGKHHIITKGSVLDAVSIAISFPGVFEPIKVGNKLMVDGGGINHCMVDVLKEHSDFVIASYIVHETDCERFTAFNKYKLAEKLFLNELIKMTLNKHKPDFCLVPKITGQPDFAYNRKTCEFCIKEGRKVTEANIEKLKKAIQEKNERLSDRTGA